MVPIEPVPASALSQLEILFTTPPGPRIVIAKSDPRVKKSPSFSVTPVNEIVSPEILAPIVCAEAPLLKSVSELSEISA